LIEIENVTKSYKKGEAVTEVLHGISFRIGPGEYVAIMGASGSGKSTLLNILGFLDRPDGGTYRLEDTDWSDADDDVLSALRNRKIGFVFQQFHLLERVSAVRNVTLPLLYAEEDVPDGLDRAERALEQVGLGHRIHHLSSELSGGEQQRVAIARALINDPALILADEPTGNLDAKNGEEIMELFQRLNDAGRTIVIVTHDPNVARRAKRVIVLQQGRVSSDETNSATAKALA
jgi:putative ABC transport system ATP-binding protein